MKDETARREYEFRPLVSERGGLGCALLGGMVFGHVTNHMGAQSLEMHAERILDDGSLSEGSGKGWRPIPFFRSEGSADGSLGGDDGSLSAFLSLIHI